MKWLWLAAFLCTTAMYVSAKISIAAAEHRAEEAEARAERAEEWASAVEEEAAMWIASRERGADLERATEEER